jgi:hypothetical protein
MPRLQCDVRCSPESRRQSVRTRIGGLFGLNSRILRVNQDHRSAADKRQRFDHPHPWWPLAWHLRQNSAPEESFQNAPHTSAGALYFSRRGRPLKICVKRLQDRGVHGSKTKPLQQILIPPSLSRSLSRFLRAGEIHKRRLIRSE